MCPGRNGQGQEEAEDGEAARSPGDKRPPSSRAVGDTCTRDAGRGRAPGPGPATALGDQRPFKTKREEDHGTKRRKCRL